METNKSKIAVQEVEQALMNYEAKLLEGGIDPVDWTTFNEKQETHRHAIVKVKNEDFKNGTLRIMAPCMLKLEESISFSPNEDSDFFPTPEQLQGNYDRFSYRLGFFTAITVETTESVIIDLNGYTLAASDMFAVQQRFHSLIELGDQPFNPSAGPADFGSDIRVAKNVWIKNGTLGRTSHHSIHGNGCENIVMSGLTFKDYEVAAISLNGCRKIYIKNCQCDGTNMSTPVLGTYSAARFCSIFGNETLRMVKKLDLPKDKEISESIAYLDDALNDLNKALKGFVDDYQKVVDAATPDQKVRALHNLRNHKPFYNGPQNNRNGRKFYGMTDGNAYGIAFHSRGPLVNSFNCPGEAFENVSDLSKALETTDIVLERVNISLTQCNVREILAMAEIKESGNSRTGKTRKLHAPIHDISGSIFQFFDTFDGQDGNMDKSGKADLTVLGRAQIALADIKFQILTKNLRNVISNPKNLPLLEPLGFLLGRSNIPKEIIDWAKGKGALKKVRFSAKDFRLNKNFSMQVLCNGDSMHHVNKGGIGLFIQSVDGLMLDNVIISGVKNTGHQGEERAGNYIGSEDGGHKSQGGIIGYSGADARGIYIGACSNVELKDPKVFSVSADYGSSYGIHIAHGNHNVRIENPIVANCHAGGQLDNNHKPQLPNKPCKAVGLAISNHNTLVKLIHPKIEGPFTQAWAEAANRLEINCLDLEIVN